ncbi:hypothetical protein GQ600_18060 [Phytophthora cactorum]|nr:hypothetical protein GQ600_18060 [Phytophthora cactorum]
MGNTASTTCSENSRWDFTASDMLLDQMEKQTCVVATPTWMEVVTSYLALVLSTMAALLMGSFSGSLDQPKRAPTLVDAACQTEDEYFFAELTVNRDWQLCHVPCKEVTDDDNHSCTTEATELFTDAENEELERDFSDDDSDWENENSENEDMLHAICDAFIAEANPKYHASPAGFFHLQRMLGYRADMIPAARECLRIWCGDEDKAFKSFVTLFDEVPRLCDPACSS